eukprot:2438215-Prymnesium_polylepis.1
MRDAWATATAHRAIWSSLAPSPPPRPAPGASLTLEPWEVSHPSLPSCETCGIAADLNPLPKRRALS